MDEGTNGFRAGSSGKDVDVQEKLAQVLGVVLGVVSGLRLWEVFPDTLGKAKPVTFYQSTHNLMREQKGARIWIHF